MNSGVHRSPGMAWGRSAGGRDFSARGTLLDGVLLVAAALLASGCGRVIRAERPVEVTPRPVEVVEGEGVFRLTARVPYWMPGGETGEGTVAGMEAVDEAFVELLTPCFGQLPLQAEHLPERGGIRFEICDTLGAGAYCLEVTREGIGIRSGDAAGAFYAVQTLRQLLPPGALSPGGPVRAVEIPEVRIVDRPCMAYRGLMLDVARHFFTVDEVKRTIDLMALHKMNVFHWHLTDDQGWRIEIRRYPELTRVGSVRRRTLIGKDPGGEYDESCRYDETPYGGYYTQAQIREVVAIGYGSQRKEDLSMAVTTVKVDDAARSRASDLGTLLQGRMPGVTIMQSGDPMQKASFSIRGRGSKGNDQGTERGNDGPTSGDGVLVVVDGVPNAPYMVEDIETITVLKDAASAAIYGASVGSSGVVLITTRQAEAGKTRVNVNVSLGFERSMNLPTMLNAQQFCDVWAKAVSNSANGSLPNLANPEVYAGANVTRTDWLDEIFRTGLTQHYGVSISGGTEKLQSILSVTYDDKEGTLLNTWSQTLGAKLHTTFQPSRHIDVIRWGLAQEYYAKPLHSVVSKMVDGQIKTEEVEVYPGRTFNPTYNKVFPIPETAFNGTVNLKQNKGY